MWLLVILSVPSMTGICHLLKYPFSHTVPADLASVLCCKYYAIKCSLLDPKYILKQIMYAMLTATTFVLHAIPIQ